MFWPKLVFANAKFIYSFLCFPFDCLIKEGGGEKKVLAFTISSRCIFTTATVTHLSSSSQQLGSSTGLLTQPRSHDMWEDVGLDLKWSHEHGLGDDVIRVSSKEGRKLI